ncbi:hypothetical protein SELMODRAFT_420626 [Selaginella moellendorffii]|uniref:Uncharacterized protein n=1 Tax=Selaginella moellendorffii TaxID=88036 RepID=D8SCL3_SELML|nr:hypothetical protein SELMODRAFT_420626 [Selaginella moellendorffii]
MARNLDEHVSEHEPGADCPRDHASARVWDEPKLRCGRFHPLDPARISSARASTSAIASHGSNGSLAAQAEDSVHALLQAHMDVHRSSMAKQEQSQSFLLSLENMPEPCCPGLDALILAKDQRELDEVIPAGSALLKSSHRIAFQGVISENAIKDLGTTVKITWIARSRNHGEDNFGTTVKIPGLPDLKALDFTTLLHATDPNFRGKVILETVA